jgi:Cu+-exporting ATPase
MHVELPVQGMTCAACAAKVESRLNAIENVSATVNIATEKATVIAPLSVPVQLLVTEIERSGYGAEVAGADDGPANADDGTADAARFAYLGRRLIVALVFSSRSAICRCCCHCFPPTGSPAGNGSW